MFDLRCGMSRYCKRLADFQENEWFESDVESGCYPAKGETLRRERRQLYRYAICAVLAMQRESTILLGL